MLPPVVEKGFQNLTYLIYELIFASIIAGTISFILVKKFGGPIKRKREVMFRLSFLILTLLFCSLVLKGQP